MLSKVGHQQKRFWKQNINRNVTYTISLISLFANFLYASCFKYPLRVKIFLTLFSHYMLQNLQHILMLNYKCLFCFYFNRYYDLQFNVFSESVCSTTFLLLEISFSYAWRLPNIYCLRRCLMLLRIQSRIIIFNLTELILFINTKHASMQQLLMTTAINIYRCLR